MEINTNTTLKHYPYPKIGQFRNVIKDIKLRTEYAGKDENGEPIYKNSIPKPIITFYGSVKIHGTNLGIILDRVNNVIYFQSRENIITPLKDNAGAASYLASIQTELWELFKGIEGDTVCIYGEWAGQSIQKGVAISQLPKAAYIFDIKVGDTWLSKEQVSKYSEPNLKIYNIWNFSNWKIDIDFNNPELSQNTLADLTLEIEKCCPVGKEFGVEGIGEGVVWKSDGLFFKVKGDQHSASHVKTLASVDVEKIQSVIDFVKQTVTKNRCEQSLQKLKECGKPIDQTSTGEFIKWIREDILKEELDTIVQNGLEVKDLNGPISKASKDWYFQNM